MSEETKEAKLFRAAGWMPLGRKRWHCLACGLRLVRPWPSQAELRPRREWRPVRVLTERRASALRALEHAVLEHGFTLGERQCS